MSVQAITPFLWYERDAEAAARLYVSLFEDSRIVHVMPGGADGGVMMVRFELRGRRYNALNGGPHYRLTEAFSMMVDCGDQADIDRLWAALGEGGSYSRCGWMTDRYGLTWQINYAGLPGLLGGANGSRVMAAMMKMQKIDVQALRDAAA